MWELFNSRYIHTYLDVINSAIYMNAHDQVIQRNYATSGVLLSSLPVLALKFTSASLMSYFSVVITVKDVGKRAIIMPFFLKASVPMVTVISIGRDNTQ